MTFVSIFAAAFALGASAHAGPLPETLASDFAGGRFAAGDYSWARGRFSDASAEEKAKWHRLKAWADARATERTAAVRDELRGLGADPKALAVGCYGDEACATILGFERGSETFDGWADFETAWKVSRPYFEGYRSAAAAMRQSLPRIEPEKVPLAEKLHFWTILEQVWRKAVSGDISPTAPLPPKARAAFNLMVWPEVASADAGNLPKLKEVVARHGWPTIADVGEQGARDAWLLVQHADNDPAFQLRVLRLMEPLAAKAAVPTRNFAYLFDRVTLKISGVQRYGTQAHCVDGRIAPRPLEQPGKLDELRRTAGLPPIAEYLKQFPGTC